MSRYKKVKTMIMENFDARDARKLTDRNTFGNELKEVLETIEKEAKNGKSRTYWYVPLHSKTIEALESKFFIVEKRDELRDVSDLDLDLDYIHYTISW